MIDRNGRIYAKKLISSGTPRRHYMSVISYLYLEFVTDLERIHGAWYLLLYSILEWRAGSS